MTSRAEENWFAKERAKVKKTKLFVLTGFLGAGKTTFLLKMLENFQGKKVGVIQNDLGKVNIDGALVQRDGLELVEISQGSIYCACRKLDFVKALAELARKGLDCVLVESSGIGDPSNVEELLQAVEVLQPEAYEFAGLLCLVDAANFLSDLQNREEVARQVRHANAVILNKTDLVEPEEQQRVMTEVRKLNPVCPILPAAFGEVDLSFLDTDLRQYQYVEGEESLNSSETKPKALVLRPAGTVPQAELNAFLKLLLPQCWRMKGFLPLDTGWHQVDAVGSRIDYKPCPARERGELVLISKIGPAIIRPIADTWKQCVSTEMSLKN